MVAVFMHAQKCELVTVSNLRMRVLKVKSTAATTTNGEEGRITGAGKVMRIERKEEKKV